MMVICDSNDDHDAIERENVRSHLIPIINETGEENYVSEELWWKLTMKRNVSCRKKKLYL